MSRGKVVRALVVVLAILLAVVAVRLRPDPEARSATSSPPATSSSSTSTSAPAATPSADTRREGPSWQRTARSFMRRYQDARGGKAAWLSRLRPVVSEDLHTSLKTVRLDNLPSGTRGSGQVQQTAEVGGVMRFPLHGGEGAAVDVTVSASNEGQLRVTGLRPVTDEGMQ